MNRLEDVLFSAAELAEADSIAAKLAAAEIADADILAELLHAPARARLVRIDPTPNQSIKVRN